LLKIQAGIVVRDFGNGSDLGRRHVVKDAQRAYEDSSEEQTAEVNAFQRTGLQKKRFFRADAKERGQAHGKNGGNRGNRERDERGDERNRRAAVEFMRDV
jgi:hypothetical protein